jgi:hypothetical protein
MGVAIAQRICGAANEIMKEIISRTNRYGD